MAAAAVDELSGGRFVLGLGSSHRVQVGPEHGVEYRKPLGRVRETVSVVRESASGGRGRARGGDGADRTLRPLVQAVASRDPDLSLRAVPEDDGAVRRDRGRRDPCSGDAGERGPGSGACRRRCRAGVVAKQDRSKSRRSSPPASIRTEGRRSPPHVPVWRSMRDSFPRYNRLLAENGFPAEAATVATAWHAGDKAAAERAVTDEMIGGHQCRRYAGRLPGAARSLSRLGPRSSHHQPLRPRSRREGEVSGRHRGLRALIRGASSQRQLHEVTCHGFEAHSD